MTSTSSMDPDLAREPDRPMPIPHSFPRHSRFRVSLASPPNPISHCVIGLPTIGMPKCLSSPFISVRCTVWTGVWFARSSTFAVGPTSYCLIFLLIQYSSIWFTTMLRLVCCPLEIEAALVFCATCSLKYLVARPSPVIRALEGFCDRA